MSSINKVFLIGNLGADPDIRHTANGTTVGNFRIATTEKWTSKEGEKKEETEWHRIVAWGKTAELCGEYLSKGRAVHIEGKLKTSKYVDKDGVEKYSTEIHADRVTFLGSKDGGRAPMAERPPTDDEEMPF